MQGLCKPGTEAGHQVQSCLSDLGAIGKLREDSLDLVITAPGMPAIDGLDVLKEAKQLCPFSEVIVTNAYARLESLVEVMELGACDCIPKTLNIDEIRDAMQVALDRVVERRRRGREDGSRAV